VRKRAKGAEGAASAAKQGEAPKHAVTAEQAIPTCGGAVQVGMRPNIPKYFLFYGASRAPSSRGSVSFRLAIRSALASRVCGFAAPSGHLARLFAAHHHFRSPGFSILLDVHHIQPRR
jgi:hypothetical protein